MAVQANPEVFGKVICDMITDYTVVYRTRGTGDFILETPRLPTAGKTQVQVSVWVPDPYKSKPLTAEIHWKNANGADLMWTSVDCVNKDEIAWPVPKPEHFVFV